MGWLRLVGSIKVCVSFANEPYKRDYILKKRDLWFNPTKYLASVCKITLELTFENVCTQMNIVFPERIAVDEERARELRKAGAVMHMCAMTRLYLCHDSWHTYVRAKQGQACICVPWLSHMCVMTYSYVWHDSFVCVPWPIRVCDMTHSCVWHVSFISVTWPIHMCDMTHSYVRHDSFIYATWPIHMCDMTHSYVRHDWFICATWLIHMCDMTDSYMRNASFICATWLIHNIAAKCCTKTQPYQPKPQLYYSKPQPYQPKPHVCGTWYIKRAFTILQHTATHHNTLQHAATRCNALQRAAAHCICVTHDASCKRSQYCGMLQHTATLCNTLNCTATH